MLSPSDLSDFDLPALACALEATALRQDRHRRLADSIGVNAQTSPETARAVDSLDADAAATAEAYRLVCLIRRFAADEGHARPKATITHLRAVPKPPAPRPGVFARALAILVRAEPTTDRTAAAKTGAAA